MRDTDRRTLVACSGGADSSALLLALATVSPGPVAAHVVHDMRPASEASADRDAARALCAELGLEFLEGEAPISGEPGNAEANARRARYEALAGLARRAGVRWVATGHHADDQLETVLMRLLRGTGARGLAGIRPSRPLGAGVVVVRPMLSVTHDEACELCRRCGWAWAEDRTNRDPGRLRAALRSGVLPTLRAVQPDAARRVSRSVESVRAAHAVVEEAARALLDHGENTPDGIRFRRGDLRSGSRAVLAELIVLLHGRLTAGRGLDRLHQRGLDGLVSLLHADSGESKEVEIAGIRITASGCFVEFS